ncbi:uncharacterized protein LOC143821820 [Paroedura picta]|uniref:uncharacterized protein LOC143821820 n=1 Tax=Paroedura picta TaxID=143630 RepID=UPI004056398A
MELITAKPRILWRHNWLSAWASLLLFWKGTAQPCPPMCQFCSANQAECEQISSLPAVLIGLPNITEKIVLRHGNLSEIPPLSFQKFPNLHFLSITGFPVSSLPDLTFSPDQAGSLRSLDLSNNHLLSCSIQPTAFSGLTALEDLALNNNSLDILQSPWFLGLAALSKLYLALNRIAYLPPKTFENLARLEELVISSNQIQYLSMDTFYGLASLVRLDLSSNRILFINSEAFQPLQALRRLLLADNRLTALPVLPSSVTFLLLHANPWHCSCQLVDSVESWADRIQESALMVCNTPPGLAGCQVISARLKGCSTSDSSLPLPTFWNLSLLYGFLGGVVIGLMVYPILCCCLKLCKGPPATGHTESKKSLLSESTSVFLGKATATGADPPILGRFPVIQNTTIGLEVDRWAKGSCPRLRETSGTCNMAHVRSMAERPLVALLAVDKVTNKMVVTLCERGHDTAGSRDEWIVSPDRLPRFLGDIGQQHFVHGEHRFCGSPFLHAAPNWAERTEYVFPVVGWSVDPRSEGQTSKSDATQHQQVGIHEDLPAGNAAETQKDGAVGRAASSQRAKSSGGSCHIDATCSRAEMKGKTSSPAHSCRPGFAYPSYAESSESRRWQEKVFAERRNLKSRARRGESSRKAAGLDSKAYRLRLSRSSRKLLHDFSHVPSYESSSLSSSSSSYSVALRPRKRTRLSLHLSAAPQTRKMRREYKKPRRSHTAPNVAQPKNASTVEKCWKCPICGCGEPHSCAIAQRGLDRLVDAMSSIQLSDVAGQPAPPKDREIARPSLVPHQNSEDLLAEDFLESTPWPRPRLPFGISHRGPSEDEEESINDPQRLRAKSPPGAKHSHQEPGTGFPVADKTVTQVILKEEGGMGKVHTVTEVGPMIVLSIKSGKVRSLGEEMYNAQRQVEAFAHAFDQRLADQEKTQVDASFDMMQPSSCLVNQSSSEMSFSGSEELELQDGSNRSNNETSFSEGEEPKLQKAPNVTSRYPLVQRMFEIDFSLPNEE